MQAVVLVGGEGTRLRPLTYGTPKPMVPLFGVPFLERTLSRLKEAGVDDVILAAGYLPEAIRDHLGDGSRLGMRITYVIEDEPLGTAGAIKNVADYITGPFFVLNGDVLTSLDLRAMVALHAEKGGLGVLHLIRVDDPSAFGCVVHDATGRISQFVEKPPRGQEPTNEVNAGTYLLEATVLDWIPAGRKVSIERETFPALLADGGAATALYAYATDDYWLDVGRPDQYQQAHRDVLDSKLTLGRLADLTAHRGTFYTTADRNVPKSIRPPAFIGRDVEIDDTAVVGPYAIVGDHSQIGARAHVCNALLWDRVVVSEGASIDGAILASGVRVGRDAHIAHGAVIGHDAVVDSSARIPPDARITGREPAQT